MKSRWNARADTTSSIILWGGGLAAGFICALWLAQNLYPEHSVVQKVDNELSGLRLAVNTACRMDHYWKNYYPKLNEGTLIMKDTQVCINSGPCKAFFYKGGEAPVYDQGRLFVSGALPCEAVESCNVVYYDAQAEPQFITGGLEIAGAISCTNTIEPVTRCRVTFCDTGLDTYIHLRDTTYINISKQGGFLNVERH